MIKCNGNGEFYVGSTRTSLAKRWRAHQRRLENNKHHNNHMQSCWNKYGPSSFGFSILEICKPEDAYDREQFFMETLKPSLNKTKDVWPSAHPIKHPGLQASHNSAFNEIVGILINGKCLDSFCAWKKSVREFFGLPAPSTLSEHTKMVMSAAQMGVKRIGTPKTPEHRAKISSFRKAYYLRMKQAGLWPQCMNWGNRVTSCKST